jgi:hypothetical protein
MLTEIVDLLVDASNTFGSLVSSLKVRYKNYNKIISQQPSLQDDVVNALYTYFPEILREMNLCQDVQYIMIDKYSVKNGKTELRVVFLNEKQRHVHSFNILNGQHTIGNLIIPSYWIVNKK